MTNTTTLRTSTAEAVSRRPSQPEPLGLLDSEPVPVGVVIAETVERARPGLEALGDTDRVQDAMVSMARRAATEARSG